MKNLFVKLKNRAEEHKGKITLLESEVKKAKAELRECRAANLSACELPSMDGIGKTPATTKKQVQSSSGSAILRRDESEYRKTTQAHGKIKVQSIARDN